MDVIRTAIPDVLVVRPVVHEDERGLFYESWQQRRFDEAVGRTVVFRQDNHSLSARNVLRGIHYQICSPQGKLVRSVRGAVWDVAVDLRRSSPTFRQWVGYQLSAENRLQLWVPEGFGHGFSVLSNEAELLYKATDYYAPECDRTIAWNDPDLAIDWRLDGNQPRISPKDAAGVPVAAAEVFD